LISPHLSSSFLHLLLKMADVKKGKTPQEFAGASSSSSPTVSSMS
jgi:hypothetical protein